MGVRWDAVVDGSRFWSEPEPRAPEAARAGEAVPVQVWLFGQLAQAETERPLTLTLQTPFSVRDVIAELGRRCGSELLAKVTGPDGGKLKLCRVFVDGLPADDPDTPVNVQTSPAQVEMILLTGIEGG